MCVVGSRFSRGQNGRQAVAGSGIALLTIAYLTSELGLTLCVCTPHRLNCPELNKQKTQIPAQLPSASFMAAKVLSASAAEVTSELTSVGD